MLGRDPGEILTRVERIDAVTPAIVQEAFRKYFPLDRYTVVTLCPETAKQAALLGSGCRMSGCKRTAEWSSSAANGLNQTGDRRRTTVSAGAMPFANT